MDSRIKRAKMVYQFMTIVFYGIALFFFLLLVGFAGKVIVGGLLGAKPEMFGFTRSGSIGNQVFNTIYLVFIHYLFLFLLECLPVFIWPCMPSQV